MIKKKGLGNTGLNSLSLAEWLRCFCSVTSCYVLKKSIQHIMKQISCIKNYKQSSHSVHL